MCRFCCKSEISHIIDLPFRCSWMCSAAASYHWPCFCDNQSKRPFSFRHAVYLSILSEESSTGFSKHPPQQIRPPKKGLILKRMIQRRRYQPQSGWTAGLKELQIFRGPFKVPSCDFYLFASGTALQTVHSGALTGNFNKVLHWLSIELNWTHHPNKNPSSK